MGRDFTLSDNSLRGSHNNDSEPDQSSNGLSPTPESENLEDWWENTETIRAKWIYDGCKTIDEIIERLHEEIEKFRIFKEEGWELIDTVEDDYGHMRKQEE